MKNTELTRIASCPYCAVGKIDFLDSILVSELKKKVAERRKARYEADLRDGRTMNSSDVRRHRATRTSITRICIAAR